MCSALSQAGLSSDGDSPPSTSCHRRSRSRRASDSSAARPASASCFGSILLQLCAEILLVRAGSSRQPLELVEPCLLRARQRRLAGTETQGCRAHARSRPCGRGAAGRHPAAGWRHPARRLARATWSSMAATSGSTHDGHAWGGSVGARPAARRTARPIRPGLSRTTSASRSSRCTTRLMSSVRSRHADVHACAVGCARTSAHPSSGTPFELPRRRRVAQQRQEPWNPALGELNQQLAVVLVLEVPFASSLFRR